MAERMTCDFMSFSTVFQSYQDEEWMIMKGTCNRTPFTVEKISPRAVLELGTARRVLEKQYQDSRQLYIHIYSFNDNH